MNTTEKLCSKCKEVKPVSEFTLHKSGRRAGKYDSWCRTCHNEAFNKYLKEHPDKFLESQKKYRATEQGKYNSINNSHIKRAGGKGGVTLQEWKDLLDKYGHKCLRCGTTTEPLTQDHVILISEGGEHVIGNLQPLCQICNSRNAWDRIDYRKL